MQTADKTLIHSLGIGTWNMGSLRDAQTGEVVPDHFDDARHVAAIRHSLSRGQNHIDTAELYGLGHTEELVGEAIRGFSREGIFVASKLWPDHYAVGQVVSAVEAMLVRLGTPYLDLIYPHTPKTDVPMAEYMAGLDEVIDRGLAKALGVSNFDLPQLKQAVSLVRHPIIALQVRYSVAYRPPANLLAYCRQSGITVVAYRPVERGEILANEAVRRIAIEIGPTPAQVALAWLVRQEGVVAIPKTSDPAHIDENVGCMGIGLTEEGLDKLSALA